MLAGLIWINFEAAAAASINRSSGYIGGIQGERAPGVVSDDGGGGDGSVLLLLVVVAVADVGGGLAPLLLLLYLGYCIAQDLTSRLIFTPD